MNRRSFLAGSLIPLYAVLNAARALSMGKEYDGGDASVSVENRSRLETIGGMSLSELHDFHYRELEDEYVAYWDTGGVDWKYGGFITRWDENGNFTTNIKTMYSMARGLWVFSHLYNHFGKRDRHYRAAKLCWDFMCRYCRDEKTGYWYSRVLRDGTFVEGSVDIYGDMYVVLALCEYHILAGERSLLNIAIETAHGINERIVSPSYQHLQAHKDGFIPGTKVLGTWQHFLSVLTPLARETDDQGVEMMARMCIRNIMEHHFSREYGVFFEYLDDTFKPFGSGYDPELRKISSWHSIQSSWMCMDEALRRGDPVMFLDALEMGRLTLDRCWLEGDEGGLIGLDYPEQNIGDSSDKPSWGRLDDAMVYTLLAIEHTNAEWAVNWFDRIFTLGYSKPERWNRRGLLHHPRRLFMCIDILDRMIARNGEVSDFLHA